MEKAPTRAYSRLKAATTAVAAFNQEKALVGAFSVITNLRMELFEALPGPRRAGAAAGAGEQRTWWWPAQCRGSPGPASI